MATFLPQHFITVVPPQMHRGPDGQFPVRHRTAAGGADLIPARGYWRDVGTIDAYFQANFDTLGRHPRLCMNNHHGPIYAANAQVESTLVRGAIIDQDNLVQPGDRIGFDLATTLAREHDGFDPFGGFLDVVRQDPVLAGIKLIAEPWDVGNGGYQVGGFPSPWAEWNGKYRDTIRSYWKGDGGLIGEMAYRLSGSSDLFSASGRAPTASVNFITAHDGFTLRDLVTYNDKHNDANGEDNRDGDGHNRSWNCGVEGETDDHGVRALRLRQMRNLLGTLLLSQGVPMLVAGDELGRTQHGNNNAYCQDTELSWLDWGWTDEGNDDPLAAEARALFDFTARLIALRNAHPLFRRRTYFRGIAVHQGNKDITWLKPDGQEMSDAEWQQAFARCIGVFLSGKGLAERDAKGRPIDDDDLVLLLNAHHEAVDFVIPGATCSRWQVCLDTAAGLAGDAGAPVPDEAQARTLAGGEPYPLPGRSLVLLRCTGDEST